MARKRRFRIPDDMVSDFSELIDLDKSSFAELQDALINTPASMYRASFQSNVADRVNFERSIAEDITHLLLFLYYAREVGGRTVSEFTEDVALVPPDEDWETFSNRLSSLLEIEL